MIKTISLTEDDHLMGYKKDDQLLVEVGTEFESGSLIVIENQGNHYVCRLEKIDGNKYLWPPRGFGTHEYDTIIVGRAVELVRSLAG